jgi:hypothetical protein
MGSAVVTLADLKVMNVEIDLNEDALKNKKCFNNTIHFLRR